VGGTHGRNAAVGDSAGAAASGTDVVDSFFIFGSPEALMMD
jgi:hypothetical protein